MSNGDLFAFLDHDAEPEANRARLARRAVPEHLGSHWAASLAYLPSPALVAAVNTALVVGAPLLVTGEPGTGKTQLAHYVARKLGLPPPFKLMVRSTTTSDDLLYTFDRIAYFQAANTEKERPSKADFVEKGPLWSEGEDWLASAPEPRSNPSWR